MPAVRMQLGLVNSGVMDGSSNFCMMYMDLHHCLYATWSYIVIVKPFRKASELNENCSTAILPQNLVTTATCFEQFENEGQVGHL